MHSPEKMICEDHSSPTYYCDEVDLCWLEAVNKQKKLKGKKLKGLFGSIRACIFVPLWIPIFLYLAISKTEVIASEDLQKAIVAFELKVSLFLYSYNF